MKVTPMDKFVPFPIVKAMVGLCRSTIYAKTKDGSFPQPVKIGRGTRWSEAELKQWQLDRLAERDGRPAA